MSYIKLHQDESPNEYDQINQVINEPLTKTDLLNKTTRLNTIKKISSLTAMMILTFCFFLLEQITGHITHSNSLVADSFHMLSDMASFLIALVAFILSKRAFTSRYTYGYVRAEILGSLINSVFLLALCFSLIIEAIQRLIEPHKIENINLVLFVGLVGFSINSFGLVLFTCLGGHHFHSHGHYTDDIQMNSCHHKNDDKDRDILSVSHGHSHDMNIHGVFLHLLADTLGSVVIILSSLLVKYLPDSEWKLYIDPLLSILLAVFISASAIPLLKAACKILMQQSRIDVNEVKVKIGELEGVVEVLEAHVWSLDSQRNVGSVCVKIEKGEKKGLVCKRIKDVFKERNVKSVNVEIDEDGEDD